LITSLSFGTKDVAIKLVRTIEAIINFWIKRSVFPRLEWRLAARSKSPKECKSSSLVPLVKF
jgi:hypothetical protein